MKYWKRFAVILAAAVICAGAAGCGWMGIGRAVRERADTEEAADNSGNTGTGKPADNGVSISGGTSSSAPARQSRTETVWPGVYALDGDAAGEIFVILGSDAQTVSGWYLYETAAGDFGMHDFTWDISAEDAFTATGPFGNGSDLTDTYRLQNDRITVEYPDGWWDDRDYIYLCGLEYAETYITNPAFDPSVLNGGYPGGAASSGDAGNAGAPGANASPGSDTAASQPFYGIWVLGSHEQSDCREMVSRLQGQGFTGAAVFYTTDWSNLNTEPWYVVTAGIYGTEDEANVALPGVQAAGYADAYVKYSGERQAYDFAG